MALDRELIIVSGPNGAGKTTFATQYVENFEVPYLGADKIAFDLDPEDPYRVRIEAGKKFLLELNTALENGTSIVVETTLSGRGFTRVLKNAKKHDFTVGIVNVFLSSDDDCVRRVAKRMKSGGHFVPEEDIRRRFHRSAQNFWNLYRPLCDWWRVIDNTNVRTVVAEGRPDEFEVLREDLFETFEKIIHTDPDASTEP